MKRDRRGAALTCRWVPFVPDTVPQQARPFLPANPSSTLRAADVSAFLEKAEQDPDTRMIVLAVLRSHASNGAEVTFSGFALLLSLFSTVFVLIGFAAAGPIWAQLIKDALAATVFVFVIVVLQIAFAAHVRKITCIAWLGAYEDALREHTTRPPHTKSPRMGRIIRR